MEFATGRLAVLIILSALWLRTYPAAAHSSTWVERVEIKGATRTRAGVLLELLPRQPPAYYSDAELHELARRIGNLEIFDAVAVTRSASTVQVHVREKWTLIPEVDFATGATWADTYILLGATEYNLVGSASQLGLSVYREQRGLGFGATFSEHEYRRQRWSFGAETSYGSSSLRFAEEEAWYLTSFDAAAWATSPSIRRDYLRYQVGLGYARETINDVEGSYRPPEGHVGYAFMTFLIDVYEWRDLVPRGVLTTFSLAPGFFVGEGHYQSRHSFDVSLRGALPLARHTVAMLRAQAGVSTRGNANASYLLGSFEGVRGLDDALYRNWAQAFLNFELRQAVPLAERWALQFVAFSDVGAFEQLDARGRRGDQGFAAGVGGGARVIPTWLAGLLLRCDVARLLTPERTWFYQLGVSQYF